MRVYLRRFSQLLFFALFVYLFVRAVYPLPDSFPRDLFLRADPLVALAASLSSRELLVSLLFAVPLIILALVAGRAFCGWICPLGTILDAAKLGKTQRLNGNGWRQRHLPRFRPVKNFVLILVLASSLFTSVFLLLFDPLSLLTRSLAAAVYPAANVIFSAIQRQGYEWGLFPDFWIGLDSALRGTVLPYEQQYFRMTFLFLAMFAGVIALNAVAPRFWCRYLCPLGAFFGLLARFPVVRRRVGQECNKCGKCARACKMGAISVNDFASSPEECVLCLNCQRLCPQEAISFFNRSPRADWAFDPSRRQTLFALGASLVAVSGLRVTAAEKEKNPWLVRPPGAHKEDFLARCIRCGECLKVCPTQGLQPAFLEAGFEGLWSPILVSRMGYCDYGCTACGQVCPTQAIAKLDLEVKRKLVIGTAYIDQNRCLPWADRRNCIVCEEVCPLPEKAIVLEPEMLKNNRGELVEVKRPRVLRELCIGCGTCEYKCPLPRQAAIRVQGWEPISSDALPG